MKFINWALATGVYIVVALSLERYVSVVFPLHFRMWNSPKRAMKAIIIAYTVPALFYIPYGIGRYSVSEKINSRGEISYGAIDSEISKTFGWQVERHFLLTNPKIPPLNLSSGLQMDSRSISSFFTNCYPFCAQFSNNDSISTPSKNV